MVPTIRDVAQRAGVSISTVSRVLNNSAWVDGAKRQRVEEAARELGYSPNPNALSLLGHRTGGIGVFLPDIEGEFFSAFLQGIDRSTRESGHYLMVSSSHRDVESFRAMIQGIHQRVDGLIVMSTQVSAGTVKTWLPEDLPVLFVNTEVQGEDLEALNFDNRGGAYAMTEHLIGQGHRRIGFLTGPMDSFDARARLEGYRAALTDHGIDVEQMLEFEGDFTMESGLAAVPRILATEPRPTALFAANDYSAYGALRGLLEAGLRVPDDMALAGFDNITLAKFASPALTTVHAPAREIGERAIKRILERISGDNEEAHVPIILPTQVIVRESTASS